MANPAATAFECPNGCDEILSVYECELGIYFGCAECFWMGEVMPYGQRRSPGATA